MNLDVQDLAKAATISHDHFIRTTDPAHKEAVQYFWVCMKTCEARTGLELIRYVQEMLENRGHIYTAKHEGWYSVSDETFYPPSQVHKSLDPATGRTRMVR